MDEGGDQVIIPEGGLKDDNATPRNLVGICDAGSICSAVTVDLLIVYTADAKNNNGGAAAVEAGIAAAVADLNNVVNPNSGVIHSFNLRHVQEITYNEAGSALTDLTSLRGTTDGNMDAVHALRDAHGADLVGLITHDGGGSCGIAYLNTNPTAYNPTVGFSVTAYGCIGANRSFAHELGHNMGLRHDRVPDNDDTPCKENHGYVNQAAFTAGAATNKRWRTILAYNNQCAAASWSNFPTSCSRLGYWSNPTKMNTGDPMGSTTPGSEADNTYILNRSMCLVAGFRERPIGTVTAGTVTCSGNNATFNVMFLATNGSGAYNVYNSTSTFTSATQVGAITGQGANGTVTIPITITGPTTAGSITLTVRNATNPIGDATNPIGDATVAVTIPVCSGGGGTCNLSANGLASVMCNDNGTGTDPSDDIISFDLNPTGTNTATTYNLTVSGGGTITPTSGTYGSATSFQLQGGSAGAGNVTVTITDATDATCTIQAMVTNSRQCSFNFTGSNSFMAIDPCSCNGDQVQNIDGTVDTKGTFSETVTVTGSAGLTVRISSNTMNTGILDPSTKVAMILPANLTETSPGNYQITFYHEDRTGYNIEEFEFSNGGAFMVVNAGLTPVKISNVCAYPQMVFSPAIPTNVQPTDPAFTLGANLVPVATPTFTSLAGHPVFKVNGNSATSFNPATTVGGNNVIIGTHDIMAGTGMGGTITAPAVPLDGDVAVDGVCPIMVSSTIAVVGDTIPTMSEWGLLIFGLLMLNLGVFAIQRKMKVVAS